jgi:hypothetical protein
MEAPSGYMKRVVFGPEGLRFTRDIPAHLVMSYQDCILAADANLEVVYVDDLLRILETTPTESDPVSSTVDSKLTHFSEYVLLSTYAVVY